MSDSKRSKAIPASQQTPINPALSLSIAWALLAGSIALYVKYFDRLGIKLPKLSSETDRLLYTIKLQVFPLATLLLAMINVMSKRVGNPLARNPLSGNEHIVEKQARILQNTVEQIILYLGNILIFALVAPDKYFYLVPLVVGLFTFGRVAFLIGYSIHPKHRVLGFAFTFGPSSVLLYYNLARIIGLC